MIHFHPFSTILLTAARLDRRGAGTATRPECGSPGVTVLARVSGRSVPVVNPLDWGVIIWVLVGTGWLSIPFALSARSQRAQALVARRCRRWWRLRACSQSKGVRTVGLTCEIYRRVITITACSVALNHGRRLTRWSLTPPVVVGGRAGAPFIDRPSHPPHRLISSPARPGQTTPNPRWACLSRTRRVRPTRITQIDRSRAARQPQRDQC
jgi:hypothetical protein